MDACFRRARFDKNYGSADRGVTRLFIGHVRVKLKSVPLIKSSTASTVLAKLMVLNPLWVSLLLQAYKPISSS